MSWSVVWAFFKRDALESLSYRAAFLFRAGGLAVSVAAMFYLARFVDTAGSPLMASYGGGYFAFGLFGMVLFNMQHTIMVAYPRMVRQAQLMGTLEPMLATPTPGWVVLVCAPLYRIASAYVSALLVLVGSAVVLGARPNLAAIPILVLTATLAPVAFASIGFISSALTMLLRRPDPLGTLFAAASTLAGGVLFPTAVLPSWIVKAGDVLPIKPTLEIARRAVFGGARPEDLVRPLGMLTLTCAVLLPIGLLSFSLAVRRARRDGSLSHY